MTSPIIIREVQRMVVTAPGPQGPPGSSGGSFYYRHDQLSASSSWVVSHNLGAYPAVTIILNGELVLADVTHTSVDSVNIVFPTPQTGVVIFS